MEGTQAIAVRRPTRWDEPMDKAMTDTDVAWLRSRAPFATLDPKSFPRSIPLDGILRYDCRSTEQNRAKSSSAKATMATVRFW